MPFFMDRIAQPAIAGNVANGLTIDDGDGERLLIVGISEFVDDLHLLASQTAADS